MKAFKACHRLDPDCHELAKKGIAARPMRAKVVMTQGIVMPTEVTALPVFSSLPLNIFLFIIMLPPIVILFVGP